MSIDGNDFLRRLEASALAALARSLSDHRIYEELSAELKLPLHAGGWAAR